MKNLLLTTILLVLFISCHTMVEDEFPDFKKIPVLNAYLQADSIIKVQMTFTANLNDSTPQYIPNAQVVIESSTGSTDTLKYSKKGWYVSKLKANVGVTFTCKADIAGFKQVHAQTTVPDYSMIYDVVFTEIALKGNQGSVISSYEFTIPNNKSKKCYWQVRFGSEYIYMMPERDSVLLAEAEPLTVFSNKKMNKDTYRVKFYIESYGSGSNPQRGYYILVLSLDESYYKYQKQLYLYEMSAYEGLGSSPQTYPLFSNVTNGLGIFTSYSVYRKSVVE